MELIFKANIDDFEECGFGRIMTEALKKTIIDEAREKVGSDEFKKFSKLASDTLVSEIKLRLQNFLDEEIVLTGGYGEKKFVGSINDLIKHRLDESLLRSVDSSGKTLTSCTTQGNTWIEWTINKHLEDKIKTIIETAKNTILKSINSNIQELLKLFTDTTIKDQVGKVFANILQK